MTLARAPGENETEPLPPLRQMLSCRETVTEVLWPAARLPLPVAEMLPLVPVTRQLTGPPRAVTVIEQWYVPFMWQPDTESVPGCVWAGAEW